jgi:glycine hydroxymethyltransferase
MPYGVDRETETIDYDQVEQLAREHSPKLIVAGCSSYSRVLDFPRFRAIADSAGAQLMVDMAHISGLIAGGAHPSPFPHAQIVTSTTQKTLRGPRGGMILAEADLARKIDFAVFPYMQGGPLMHVIAAKAVCFEEAMQPEFSHYAHQVVANAQVMAQELSEAGVRLVAGGTDNHLMLVDLTPLNITGRRAERALESVGIVANKNAIPFDQLPPRTASGLRLGTPAITSRGMGEDDTRQVTKLIVRALSSIGDDEALAAIGDEVRHLAGKFPVPGLDDA